MENKLLLSRQEAAQKLGISLQLLDDMRLKNELAYVRLGRLVFIKDSDIKEFLERMTVPAK